MTIGSSSSSSIDLLSTNLNFEFLGKPVGGSAARYAQDVKAFVDMSFDPEKSVFEMRHNTNHARHRLKSQHPKDSTM